MMKKFREILDYSCNPQAYKAWWEKELTQNRYHYIREIRNKGISENAWNDDDIINDFHTCMMIRYNRGCTIHSVVMGILGAVVCSSIWWFFF